MEYDKTDRLLTLLPWYLIILLLVALTIYGIYNRTNRNPFISQSITSDLVSAMHVRLFEAIDAEKIAVLTITDEDSEPHLKSSH